MLTAITLENFKCFREQYVKISPLTLLTGLNGMGKSSVVQALLLLRQSVRQGMLPSRGLLLNGPLVELGVAGDVLYRGAERDEIGLALETREGTSHWRFAYGSRGADVMPMVQEPAELPHFLLTGSDCHYLSAERIGPRMSYEVSHYEVEQRREMGADGRFAVAYLGANGARPTSEYLRHPQAADTSVRSQVVAWLGEITPGTQITTTPFPQLNRMTLTIGFEVDRTRSQDFRPPNVGFGLSYVLPILVAVLASPAGTTIMVENPEAHLHPRGQVAMGRLSALGATSGLQILVETHSDHILNGVRLAVKDKIAAPEAVAVHYFQRRIFAEAFEHFIDSPELDQDGRFDRWPDGFFDEWEKSLDDLLT